MSYLRSPHVSGDTVVFVADDDVWSVPVGGGAATRLTADSAPVSRPRLSPDGAQLAWASRRDGTPEVYLAPVAGGAPRRLTHWGSPQTRVLGWDDAGRVVAASPVGQPFTSRAWAYALDPATGGDPAAPPQRLPYGPIGGLARAAGGAVAVQSVRNREAATWQRYRGGTAGKLWVDPDASGTFGRLLAEVDGQLSDPVWLGDRLVFLSDHEGHGNVYSVLVDGSDLRRHSDHEGRYARDLAGDLTGRAPRAVYARDGQLWLLEDLSPAGRPRPLDVTLPGVRRSREPQPQAATPGRIELSLDGPGRGSVVGLQGTVQWLPHRDGPAHVLADAPGVRARLPRVLPGPARAAVWVTDAEGDDALAVGSPEGTRLLAGGRLGRVLELVVLPDGGSVAVATHDGRVLTVALADGEVRELAREVTDASHLAASPDSAWLAWSAPSPTLLRQIKLADLRTGAVHDATPVRFEDTEPVFTLDGRYLAFLSARTFDPVYDSHGFELSFPVAIRPYLLPLQAGTPSPFGPELEGRPVGPAEPAGPPAEREPEPVQVRVDLDGLAERVVAVPVAAGLYRSLRAAKDGLLWLAVPLAGVLGQDVEPGERRRPALHRWDLPSRRALTLVPELDDYAVSGDGTRIAVRDGEALRVGPADHRVQPGDQPDGPPPELVEVDLGRVVTRPDPVAQWRQMLTETWRLMRDHFWVEDMAGVDWPAVLDRYLPVVDRLASRDDLSELLWEMVGELGSSHAYERPPDQPVPPGRAAAFLGADLSRDEASRWRVDRVLPGDSSVPGARSPLAAPTVDVRAGDVLLAVAGRPVPPEGPGPLLAGRADTPVELTVERDGAARQVVVVPLADETPLRYQDWVAGRRAEVHERTGGRVGYVHLPDMVGSGWAEFHRALRAEFARDALVVDTRENRGGHVSQLVLERLARRPIGWDVARHHPDSEWPRESPRGPLVSLANEFSGSDGDIVNQGFQELGLGPVVGTRTWGGVIGIDGRYTLVDGSAVTQPRYAFWFAGAGWGVENHGVDPDVEVPMPPQAWVAGEDPQLAEGLRLVQAAMADRPPLPRPDPATRPDRRPPPLPPR